MVEKLEALQLKVSVSMKLNIAKAYKTSSIQISTLSDSMLTGKGKCPVSESRGASSPYNLLPSGKESLFTHVS